MVVCFSKTNVLAMFIVVFVVTSLFAKQNGSFHSQTQSKSSAISAGDARLAMIKVSDEAEICMKKQKYREAVERYLLVIRQAEKCGHWGDVYKEIAKDSIGDAFYRWAMETDKVGNRTGAVSLLKKSCEYNNKRAKNTLERWSPISDTNLQGSSTNKVFAASMQQCSRPHHGQVRTIQIGAGEVDLLMGDDKDAKKVEFVWCDPDNDGHGFWISKYELCADEYSCFWPLLGRGHLMQGAVSSFYPIAHLDKCSLNLLLEKANELVSGHFYIPTVQQWRMAAEVMPMGEKIYAHNVYDYAWCEENSNGKVHERGGRRPNGLGLYDIWGNVGELCRTSGSSNDLLKEVVVVGGDYKTSKSRLFSDYRKWPDGGVRLCYSDDKTQCPQIQNLIIDPHKAEEKIRRTAKELGIEFDNRPSIWPWRLNVDVFNEKSLIDRSCVVKIHNNVKFAVEALFKAQSLYSKMYKGTIGHGERSEDWRYRLLYGECEVVIHSSRLWTDIVNGVDSRGCYFSFLDDKKDDLELVGLRSGAEDLLRFLEIKDSFENQKSSGVETTQHQIATGTDVERYVDVPTWYQRHKGALAIIKCGKMTGTGFVARDPLSGVMYLYTNRHVIEGQNHVVVETIGGGNVYLSSLEYAEGYDLARCRVNNKSRFENSALTVSLEVPPLDEPIFIIGNSDGKGVQSLLKGTVIGVVPKQDMVEISAQIVQGNSGSPVVDRKGRVFSVASFAITDRQDSDLVKAGTRFNETRRFSICLSAVKSWKKVR